MASRWTHAHNFFVVRWDVPEAKDCAAIERQLPNIRAQAGKPLVYVAVMPGDSPPLGEGERRLLMELTEAVLPHCAQLIIVIEARGFRGAIVRSAMTAVTLLTRRHDTLRVVDSLDAALELARENLPDLPTVLAAIHEVGCKRDEARVA